MGDLTWSYICGQGLSQGRTLVVRDKCLAPHLLSPLRPPIRPLLPFSPSRSYLLCCDLVCVRGLGLFDECSEFAYSFDCMRAVHIIRHVGISLLS